MLNKKQLNKCQAWIYYDGKDICNSKHVALVSYSTLICVFDYDSYCMYVGENFNCSATTRKHLSTFCSKYMRYVTYYDIRDYLIKGIDRNSQLEIRNSFDNSLYWRGCFSAWRLENAITESRLG